MSFAFLPSFKRKPDAYGRDDDYGDDANDNAYRVVWLRLIRRSSLRRPEGEREKEPHTAREHAPRQTGRKIAATLEADWQDVKQYGADASGTSEPRVEPISKQFKFTHWPDRSWKGKGSWECCEIQEVGHIHSPVLFEAVLMHAYQH